MKILCVGGGPAGLYFALLLKKANPEHDITVLERNAPGETFGWGVVFSDETLGYLGENDAKTHEEITQTFAHWDAIDVHYKGEIVRSGGHGFSGIARKKLLQILQARCRELGVNLVFNVEIEPDPAAWAGYDLVVAADGVNSKVRKLYESTFRPQLDVRSARYMWLGTKKLFDAFTFLFAHNDDGVFQVHAYRFDDTTSTFIVECDERSWLAAGLDRKSIDESIAYMEKLFARQLDGERLMPNKSSWIQFVTVKNEAWSAGNVVLLGDAAHTAHFSIGSGTKMAMEDSIALAQACILHPSVPEALAAYEAFRRPMIERTQKAAQDSLMWFENVRRYLHFDPIPFAFSLLTRSKRITYENLKLRDPSFVDAVTQHFASTCKDLPPLAPDAKPPPPMFTPLRLRELTLMNRVVVSPMCMYSADNGLVNDFHLVHLGSRAVGGAGLLCTEMTDVSAEGRITPKCAGMYLPEHVAAWKRIVDFVHAQSKAAFCMQLGHAGRKGSTRVPWEGEDVPLAAGNWPLLAASPIPYTPESQVPREMDRADMERVKGEYVRAVVMAEEAGFDMIELHMAHGYLLSGFVSPLSNTRKDSYGGSLENRLRFPLEVFEAARAAWPAHKPMSVRISATDWVPGAFDGDDAVIFARALAERGCDIVDVSTGQTSQQAQPVYGRMFQARFADQIGNEAHVRTMSVGNIMDHDQVNTLLASHRADLCVLARPHLKNPNFTLFAAHDLGFTELPWPAPYNSVRPR
ncbi:MAG: yqjM [Myxococcaceae bacterium]|nr:yqjM [Myxococcaceae bacterium]